MYFITTKRMLEVCFSAHPNIQYRTIYILIRPELRAPAFFSLQMLLQRLDNIHDKDTFLFCQFMQCLP